MKNEKRYSNSADRLNYGIYTGWTIAGVCCLFFSFFIVKITKINVGKEEVVVEKKIYKWYTLYKFNNFGMDK